MLVSRSELIADRSFGKRESRTKLEFYEIMIRVLFMILADGKVGNDELIDLCFIFYFGLCFLCFLSLVLKFRTFCTLDFDGSDMCDNVLR